MGNQIIQIAIACIISAGGIGGIIIAVVKFSVGQISGRLFEKYKAELDRQTEQYKTELSKKEYVSKTRFDAEFSIYREISRTFGAMMKTILTIMPVKPLPVSDNALYLKKKEQELFLQFCDELTEAKEIFSSNIPFVPQKFVVQMDQIINCVEERMIRFHELSSKDMNPLFGTSSSYVEDDYAKSYNIHELWMELCKEIRDYLSKLDVVD